LFGIGSQELLILFLVVLLLFGADRIPEVARALGKSIRDFKRAAGEIETEIQQVAQQKESLLGKKGGKRPHPKGPAEDIRESGEPAPEVPDREGGKGPPAD